jgi:hypothetical protein
MRNLRDFRSLLWLAVAAVIFSPVAGFAQGCIVARSSPIDMAPESQGGYLQPGDWNITIGYRHQFSYKHFVGSVEQTYRVQQGTQVMNKINLQDIDVSYQLTPRFSLGLSIPILLASRRSNNSFYTTHASGLGDTSLVFQGWIWNPKRARRGNVRLGFGVQAPSGKDNVQNNVLTSATTTTPSIVTADYSIQPGSGGWGMVFQWQAFRDMGHQFLVYNQRQVSRDAGWHERRIAQRERAESAVNCLQRDSGSVSVAGGCFASDIARPRVDTDVWSAHGRRAGE